jgi:hypothetical protein
LRPGQERGRAADGRPPPAGGACLGVRGRLRLTQAAKLPRLAAGCAPPPLANASPALFGPQGWRGFNNPWMAEGEEEEDYLYINLLTNPERYTGYKVRPRVSRRPNRARILWKLEPICDFPLGGPDWGPSRVRPGCGCAQREAGGRRFDAPGPLGQALCRLAQRRPAPRGRARVLPLPPPSSRCCLAGASRGPLERVAELPPARDPRSRASTPTGSGRRSTRPSTARRPLPGSAPRRASSTASSAACTRRSPHT